MRKTEEKEEKEEKKNIDDRKYSSNCSYFITLRISTSPSRLEAIIGE
jgi:hypothetical protein